jgi:hypothetical protein
MPGVGDDDEDVHPSTSNHFVAMLEAMSGLFW